MSNLSLDQLTAKTTPTTSDVLYLLDVEDTTTPPASAAGSSKSLTINNLVTFLNSSTKVLTNTTFDTAGTGNVFKINGITVSTVTGTGANVLATSPTLVTPTLGVATATSINGLTITTSTGTLTIANGKTITGNNSLTLAGTDATTMTFPSTSDTVVTLGATQTLTSKTLTTPIIGQINDSNGNSILIASAQASSVNQITIKNAATTVAPQIAPTGTDSNINLDLRGKGNGVTMLEGVRYDFSSGTITNQYKPRVIIQYGWFYITGTGASSEFTYALTFPIAFAAAEYSVGVSGIGGLSGSNPASQSALGGTIGSSTAPICQFYNMLAASCTVDVYFPAAAPGNGVRVGIQWIAVGAI